MGVEIFLPRIDLSLYIGSRGKSTRLGIRRSGWAAHKLCGHGQVH